MTFQAALQYKPRITLIKGKISHVPATYRRLRTEYQDLRSASEAAIEFHSRYLHKAITVPVVISGRSADGSFRFEFAQAHANLTDVSL